MVGGVSPGDGEVGVRFDFDDDPLPATRRAVRWLLVLLAIAGLLDGLGPLSENAGTLPDRTVLDLTLTTVALSLPWLVGALLLKHRPRLATGMAVAMAVVTVPRQVWQLWLLGIMLRAEGAPLFPDLVPRLTVIAVVLLTVWLGYLSRARGHWRGKATPITRRALVPVVMALLWTVGPIADPVPATGAPTDGLLPIYLRNPVADPEPWLYLAVHALPVLVAGALAVGRHRRVAGAGMMVYGVASFLLLLAEMLRGRALYGSSLLPLGGVVFLGLVSVIVIGHQWSTEGTRFADPGQVPEPPGQPVA